MGEIWGAVAGAVVSAGIAYGASELSKPKGGGSAYGSTPKLPGFTPVNQAPYNPRAGAQDFAASLGDLMGISKRITKFNTELREGIMPGAKEQFRLASNSLQGMLKGQLPQDVVDSINRQVAERTGGTNTPFRPGGQANQATASFARNIGETSADFMMAGLSAAPVWQQLADSFTFKPQQAAQIALGYGQQRLGYDQLNANIDMFNSSGGYTAGANQAMAAAQPDPGVVGGMNDALKWGSLLADLGTSYFGNGSAGSGGGNSLFGNNTARLGTQAPNASTGAAIGDMQYRTNTVPRATPVSNRYNPYA